MKKVLVLRAVDQSKEFADALAANGLEAVCVPVIEILPAEDWAACDAALIDIENIEALVFTSANGVRYFVERMARVGRTCDDLPAAFGLGSKTQATMIDCGLNLLPTDPAMNAAALASEICSFMTNAGYEGLEGMRFLFPCGDKARTELPAALHEHGAVVDSVVVYRNVPASSTTTAPMRELFDEHAIACVAFFSPSQVDAFVALIPEFQEKFRKGVIIAAIGMTTTAALQATWIIPDVISSSPESSVFAGEIAATLASQKTSA